ncbi:MAG: right-handed parallel beta-helix repeat-containing protein [Acidimicrobiales bacterium]
MKSKRTSAAALAAISVLGVLSWVTPADAAVLSCGQTITVNTVLDNDIGPCPAGGITIGADNITFDLNGHRITGTNFVADLAGVYLLNRTGVTVKNGTVSKFDIGVAITGGSGNTVTGITASDNIGGQGGLGGDGIAILSSRANKILSNRTQNNAPYSGIGLYSRIDNDHPRQIGGPAADNVVHDNQVLDNNISRNRVNQTNTDNDGIRVENDAVRNTFTNNTVNNSGLDGISLFADTADNVLRYNTVTHSGFYRTTARRGSGIIVFTRSKGNILEYNSAYGNADSGIDIRQPIGAFPGASNNRIAFNAAVGNAALPFIPSPVFGPSFDLKDGNLDPPCDANTWFANRYRTFNQPCVTIGGQQV